MQPVGDAAQHTKRVAFVARGLKAADLLLRGLEKFGEVLLRKTGLLAENGDLKSSIPRLAEIKNALSNKCHSCHARVPQISPHTQLVRDGSVMLPPTTDQICSIVPAPYIPISSEVGA